MPGERRRDVADALIAASVRGRGPAGPVSISRVCARCGGDHGPVRVDGAPVRASVTYAGDHVVVATIPDAGGPGHFAIDAERRDLSPDALARIRSVLRDEHADAASWTRVEAALKADGRGLRVDPAAVVIRTEGTGWTARVPGSSAVFRVVPVEGPAGVAVSVAISAATGETPDAAGAAAPSHRATR